MYAETDLIGFVAAYLLFSVAVGALAVSWGHNGGAWFGAALLFSPILVAIVLVYKGRRAKTDLAEWTCTRCEARVSPRSKRCWRCEVPMSEIGRTR